MTVGIPLNGKSFGQHVTLATSNEAGIITGFARHMRAKPLFYVEYRDALGSVRCDWFYEDQLTVISAEDA